jgi:hypothetical protein
MHSWASCLKLRLTLLNRYQVSLPSLHLARDDSLRHPSLATTKLLPQVFVPLDEALASSSLRTTPWSSGQHVLRACLQS